MEDNYIKNNLLQEDYSWLDETGHNIQTGLTRGKYALLNGHHISNLNAIDTKLKSLDGLEYGTELDPTLHPVWDAETNPAVFTHPADALAYQMEQGGETYTEEYAKGLQEQKDEALNIFVKGFSDHQKELFALGQPHPEVIQGFKEISEQEGWVDTFSAIMSNPKAASSAFFE
jgi:hypothetical protein